MSSRDLEEMRKLVGECGLADSIEEALSGKSVVSIILRMIAYQTVPAVRDTLDKDFPSEVRYKGEDGDEQIINFIQDVIKFGATSVRKERIFFVGHQGSGKTSLAHSLRLDYRLYNKSK